MILGKNEKIVILIIKDKNGINCKGMNGMNC